MKMQNTAGVGNSGVATYYGFVRIEIPIKVGASLTFSTVAGFTVGMDHVGFGLLGQMGFFERFPTTFNYPDKTFTVKA